MKYIVPEAIRQLVPYSPGKPIAETKREFGLTQVVKLASNENPLGPSPRAVDAIREALSDLHRYPDASFFELRAGFAQYFQIIPQRITFGNGSNELIDHLIRIFCSKGKGVLTSDKAFIAYRISASVAGCPLFETPLTKDFRFDVPKIIKTLDKNSAEVGLVFVPNPNNPTGTIITDTELGQLVSTVKRYPHVLLVLDEAYAEFVHSNEAPKGIEWQKKDPQICLLRTLSKVFGLAGVRLGALIGDEELISLVDRVRNPFNVNSLAQVAALATLNDRDYLRRVCEINEQGLSFIQDGLARLGVFFCPSQANFVFFDSERPAQALFHELLKRGVIIRPLLNYGFKTQLRVSVGLPEENRLFLNALKEAMSVVEIAPRSEANR